MAFFRRICAGLRDKGILVSIEEDLGQYMTDKNADYYVSIFEYNDEQFKQFQEKGTVAGIVDVSTTRLIWDFDSKDNPDLARRDALEVCDRLQAQGVPANAIRTGFSGSKGYAIEVEMNYRIGVKQFKNLTSRFADGLTTYDRVVSNPSRIVRAFYTKHQSSGLYKYPLTLDELGSLSTDVIKQRAATLSGVSAATDELTFYTPSEEFVGLSETYKEEERPAVDLGRITTANKPRGMSNCRWFLQNGAFGDGERNNALITLAAYYRSQGFEKEHTYRLLKGVAELQARRNNSERFADREIWNTVITSVYGPNWKGGIFTCRDPESWVHGYCTSLGAHKCRHDEHKDLVQLSAVSDKFFKFAREIDENTIKTGIKVLDDKVMLTTSMLVGLLAGPSAGKTTVSYEILNNVSNTGINAQFYSMDMGLPLVYIRLIQKHTRLSKEEIFKIYRNGGAEAQRLNDILNKEYKNVTFCFKSGLTVPDIKAMVLDQEQATGKKIRLLVLDYLECIASPFSDSTASSALIAQQLKDLANETETCVVLLLQTQKVSGDPSEPLLSMRKIKGASAIEQACSVVITLSRPGFSPRSPENDRFMTISTVKDRMGQLMSADCGFDGLTGNITYPLDHDEVEALDRIRAEKAQEKQTDEAGSWA